MACIPRVLISQYSYMDPDAGRVDLYRLSESRYGEATLLGWDGVLETPVPGLSIGVDGLLGTPED